MYSKFQRHCTFHHIAISAVKLISTELSLLIWIKTRKYCQIFFCNYQNTLLEKSTCKHGLSVYFCINTLTFIIHVSVTFSKSALIFTDVCQMYAPDVFLFSFSIQPMNEKNCCKISSSLKSVRSASIS